MKSFYKSLEEKEKRIVEEGIKLSKRKKMPSRYCEQKCASCLAAEARGNVDKKDYGFGFSSDEDICMIHAADILAEKLKWNRN